jgi:predicted nucleic acid-binding protein
VNAYVDSSVLLRVVLGEPGRLRAWRDIDVAVSSELIRVECLRTIDRARIRFQLGDEETSRRRADMLEAIEAIDLVALAGPILDRAAEPFPTLIGTLDALHLASALLVRERYEDLVFATHDEALGVAARAVGFPVQGVRGRT